MHLPQPLQSLLRTRRFWTDFFWETHADFEAYPELDGCTLGFPVAPGYVLALTLDDSLSFFSLAIKAPAQEAVRIGWDDEGHYHPHTLRWPELELLCRAIALQDPDLPHPGLPLLLLHRFAPICPADDLDSILPMLVAAWAERDLFSQSEIRDFVERRDTRDGTFTWRDDAETGHWYLDQQDPDAPRGLYTLRHPVNPEFPHNELNQMLRGAQSIIDQAGGSAGREAAAFAQSGDLALVPAIFRGLQDEGQALLADILAENGSAARACWLVEVLLGLPAGSLVRQWASPIHLREPHRLLFCLPLIDPIRPLPESAPKLLYESLKRVLNDRHLGDLEFRSSSQFTDETYSILTKDDLGVGVRLVRQMLWWARAPETVSLRTVAGDEFPLYPNGGPDNVTELCLQFGRLVMMHWELFGEPGHRFDRVPFDPQIRAALRQVLSDAGAIGPDADGWFTIALPDGGRMQVCLRHLENDPDLDGGTVLVQQLTFEVARVVHELLGSA